MIMQDIRLPRVKTRKELMDFLTDSINLSKHYGDLPSERLGKLKTYILESHDGFTSFETDDLVCNVVDTKVDDIKILCVDEKRHDSGTVEFYLETSDDRFFLLHTNERSEFTSRIINSLARDLKHTFDHAWFYSNMLKRLSQQTGNHFKGFDINYSNKYFRMEESSDSDDLNISINGSSIEMLEEIIANHESCASKTAFSKIRVARGDISSPNDSIHDVISYDGCFSIQQGKSIQDHLQLVDIAKDEYSEIISNIESQSIGFKEIEGRTLFEGKSFDFIFHNPVDNLSLFMKNLFNSAQPFQLWGMKTKIHDDYFKVLAIDLHTGSPLDFEISNDMMRVYLFKGSCGSIILKLLTNLQIHYDSTIKCDQLS